MREMKDSGIAWIGEIPREWEVFRIKEMFKNKSVKGFPDERVLSLYRDLGVVYKDSRDDNHNVTSEDTSSYKLVDEGDFVLNKMKAWQGSMAVSDYRGIISPAYYICTFKRTDVCKKYIHHLLRNESYKPEYMRLSSGLRVGQWDLNIDTFLNIPMILPPLSEQHLISSYLDAKCSEIDSALSLQEQMISELRAYKQSLITETVTHGLNPNAKMKNSGVEWIGEIPEGWEVKRVKNVLAECNEYTQTGKEEQLSVTQAKGIIRSKDANIANPTNSTVGWRIVHRNNIVFNKYKAHSGVFFVSPYEGIVTFNYCVYECFNKDYPKYYEYLFKTPCCIGEFRKLMRGVGESISPLYTKDLFAIFIPCPPIKDQHAIASFLDEKCAEIDALIVLREKKMEALKEYKKSLIYECVTGKKQVI